jgi:endonuclease III
MTKNDRFQHLIAWFSEHMPVAETELRYHDPYELAVATILSAQCTDKRVNMITPAFFRRFPTPQKLANATQEEIFALIKSCSYPNNKAKNLLGMAQKLVSDYNGIMPEDTAEMQKLPGVGRKTAHVLASVLFNKPALAVDTHVHRVAARIGLTTGAKNALQTELQLVRYIPEHLIPKAHHWLILHGRYVCTARNPKCSECGIAPFCKYFEKRVKG